MLSRVEQGFLYYVEKSTAADLAVPLVSQDDVEPAVNE